MLDDGCEVVDAAEVEGGQELRQELLQDQAEGTKVLGELEEQQRTAQDERKALRAHAGVQAKEPANKAEQRRARTAASKERKAERRKKGAQKGSSRDRVQPLYCDKCNCVGAPDCAACPVCGDPIRGGGG